MKKGLSLFTLGGIFFGIGLFVWAITSSTDNYLMFVSLSSIVMVLGGTIAASMISYHGAYVFRAVKSLGGIIMPYHITRNTLTDELNQIIEWAKVLRAQGLKGLEQDINNSPKVEDPFIKFGSDLLSGGHKGDPLRDMLEISIESSHERSMVQAKILTSMSSFAPAFGMIGTLVGLIIMLDNMGGDIAKVGPGMAVALLTTLYGVLLAQLIFKPAAEKVQQTLEILRYRNILLLEGFVLLSDGKSAFEIQDRLNSFLDPSIRIDLSAKE